MMYITFVLVILRAVMLRFFLLTDGYAHGCLETGLAT